MSTPALSIACSSVDGKARLARVAAGLLDRMDPALAAQLARRVMVLALDGTRHAAFAQGLGGPHDVVGQLAKEQLAQGEPPESMAFIVINMDARHHPLSLEQTLAHELGHVACGHTDVSAAAEPLTDEQTEAFEREANAFAARYLSAW
jgi:hypothetical protein